MCILPCPPKAVCNCMSASAERTTLSPPARAVKVCFHAPRAAHTSRLPSSHTKRTPMVTPTSMKHSSMLIRFCVWQVVRWSSLSGTLRQHVINPQRTSIFFRIAASSYLSAHGVPGATQRCSGSCTACAAWTSVDDYGAVDARFAFDSARQLGPAGRCKATQCTIYKK